MPRNGSGTYSLPVGNPVVTGTTISSTWANNTLTDISNALTGSLSADGQTTASGNLNMGTNKIVNAGDPTNAQDVATKYYVDQLIGALGTMAYQNANNVAITGGAISNVALDLHAQTGEMYLPVGPTILRTATPIAGLLRWNTDAGGFYEGYDGTEWVRFQTYPEGNYTITYMLVAGGGGGGGGASGNGGGGGAGGLLQSTLTVTPSNVYYISIGGGGTAGNNFATNGTNGTNSSITGIATAIGGGYGGANNTNGNTGGSGGGAGENPTGISYGGSGTVNQGNAGANSSSSYTGGGGGGAGAAATSANGGIGYLSTITGSGTYFAGGGGGNPGGSGGSGGGGAANNNGTINTGGGGGAGSGNGGSGVCILSIPTASYSGTYTGSPVISVSGGNTILQFNSSGTYTG